MYLLLNVPDPSNWPRGEEVVTSCFFVSWKLALIAFLVLLFGAILVYRVLRKNKKSTK